MTHDDMADYFARLRVAHAPPPAPLVPVAGPLPAQQPVGKKGKKRKVQMTLV